jgi:hypothetical protein
MKKIIVEPELPHSDVVELALSDYIIKFPGVCAICQFEKRAHNVSIVSILISCVRIETIY